LNADRAPQLKASVIQLSFMRLTKPLAILMVICNLILVAPGQHRRSQKVERDVRIRKHHPTVYITFEGFGEVGNSLEAGKLKTKEVAKLERGQYIWLRLHNNTRWVIDIPTVDLFLVLGGVKVIHPRYQVEAGDGTRAPVNEEDKGYWNSLRPGQAVFFPILREHLSGERKIYINFMYKWEYDNEHSPLLEPIHRVEFGSEQLPKNAFSSIACR
jgi:hypothetical protein